MISKKVFIEKCKELAKNDPKVLLPHIFKWDEPNNGKEPFDVEVEQLYKFLLDNNFFAENIVKTKSAAGEFNDDELDLIEDCLYKEATAIQAIIDKINK